MAYTAKQVWEGMLTELSKVNAPSMLLHEFNYYFNKAINQYINKRYNIYDISQQTTDDLRVLKANAVLTVNKISNSYKGLEELGAGGTKLFGGTYEVILPDDYLHMLNCVCIYKMLKTYKCYDQNNYVLFAAKRLTADSWSVVINDYYNRPLPERPYYYIHNVNTNVTVPTNPLTPDNPNGTDLALKYQVGATTVKQLYYDGDTEVFMKGGVIYQDKDCTVVHSKLNVSELKIVSTETREPSDASNFPREIVLGNPDNRTVSVVEKDAGTRYGNASKVRCEIRYGNDDRVFQLEKVYIDYIKAPQTIRLTQEQLDTTEDISQIMEFPDYVCQEIINELVLLVMQRDADPRLQSQVAVTQSIANPAQQLTSQPNRKG